MQCAGKMKINISSISSLDKHIYTYISVNCHVKGLTLEQAIKTQSGVGQQHHAPAALPLGKEPGTHFIGDCVDPTTGLDGCEKFSLPRDSIPGPLSP